MPAAVAKTAKPQPMPAELRIMAVETGAAGAVAAAAATPPINNPAVQAPAVISTMVSPVITIVIPPPMLPWLPPVRGAIIGGIGIPGMN